MEIYSLGKIAPTTPGTPVQLTTDDTIKAQAVFASQIGGTTGRVLLGRTGLNKATLAGCIKPFLPPSASGWLDSFAIEAESNSNCIQLSKYVVDADVANEGLVISYTVV